MTDDSLETLDPKTFKTPKSRLKDADSGLEVFNALNTADRASAQDRVKVQEMVDGVPPIPPGRLKAMGQGYRSNLNFLEAAADIEAALAAYADLINGVDRLGNITLTEGDETQRHEWEEIVGEEIHRTITGWDQFHFQYSLLTSHFVINGVGIAYHPDAKSWHFEAAGFGDFLIPRRTKAADGKVDIAVAKHTYTVSELFKFIENADDAKKLGWNVAKGRKAILEALDRRPQDTDWEALNREVKSNDLYFSHSGAKEIPALHFYVREFDGSYSFYIALRDSLAKDGPDAEQGGWLYQKLNAYDHVNQGFTIFPYGVGNGTFHSIRGLGYKIFPHIQVSNRLRNTIVDGTTLSASLVLQGKGETDLQKSSLAVMGPLAVLPPNYTVIPTNMPNPATYALPVVRDMEAVRHNNTGGYSPRSVTSEGTERTAFEVQAQLAKESTLSVSSINLFYVPWSKLLKEMVRRLIDNPHRKEDLGGEAALEFRKRCEDRGVPWSAVKSWIDFTPVRAVGAGSPGNRLAAFGDLMRISGTFDEQGRENLSRDMIAARVGWAQVDRYLPRNKKRMPLDAKIAELENGVMQGGREVLVLDGENHFIHGVVHATDAMRFVQAVEQQKIDPETAYKYLVLAYKHLGDHVNRLQGDKLREREIAELIRMLNQIRESLTGLEKMLQAQAEQQQKQQAQAQLNQMVEQGRQSAATEAEPQKVQLAQMELEKKRLEVQRVQQDIERERLKFQRESALQDAEAASKLQSTE